MTYFRSFLLVLPPENLVSLLSKTSVDSPEVHAYCILNLKQDFSWAELKAK